MNLKFFLINYSMNVTIILTTTVFIQNKIYLFQKDPIERLKTYNKSIHNWIKNSKDIKIIVVENSGYTFNEFKKYISDRFEIITFNENTLPEAQHLVHNNSKGASELFSINYAINNSKNIKDDFIIKITGRYFIPGFEEYLSQFDLNQYDALSQHSLGNCEVIGCSYNKKNILFNEIITDFHVENMYIERKSNLNLLICKIFSIEDTQAGGNNVIMNSL